MIKINQLQLGLLLEQGPVVIEKRQEEAQTLFCSAAKQGVIEAE